MTDDDLPGYVVPMRRRSGQVFIVTYSNRDKVLGFYGWVADDAHTLNELARSLDRSNSCDGFVPFGRGFEDKADQARLQKHVASGKPIADFDLAEPRPPQVFPRVSCVHHGSNRLRFLICENCGHIEDMDADPHGPPVMECPGGCGAPFTPLAHPEDFTARMLCLVCGIAATSKHPHEA